MSSIGVFFTISLLNYDQFHQYANTKFKIIFQRIQNVNQDLTTQILLLFKSSRSKKLSMNNKITEEWKKNTVVSLNPKNCCVDQ